MKDRETIHEVNRTFYIVLLGWLTIAGLLSAASYCIEPYLQNYSTQEGAFVHEYAEESLKKLEEIEQEGRTLCMESYPDAINYYWESAEEFRQKKEAAVHLRGAYAADFVYTFALAEEWCQSSARFLQKPEDAESAVRAQVALNKARAELATICEKEYRQMPQESR